MNITPGKWRTRDGRVAEVVSVGNGTYPVKGTVGERHINWTEYGYRLMFHHPCDPLDLIEPIADPPLTAASAADTDDPELEELLADQPGDDAIVVNAIRNWQMKAAMEIIVAAYGSGMNVSDGFPLKACQIVEQVSGYFR